MQIEIKKPAIIIIFLLTIIGILIYQNHNLKMEFYNVLIVGPEDDLTQKTLTKKVINETKEINDDPEFSKYYNNIKLNYVEYTNGDNINSLQDKIKNHNMIILIGESYNKNLLQYVVENKNKKFVLIENTLDIKQDNVYKINLKWENIITQVNKTLENIEQKEIDNKIKEKSKNIIYFTKTSQLNGIELANITQLKELGYFVTTIPLNDKTQNNIGPIEKNITKAYKEENTTIFINLNQEKQLDIVKILTRLQKENMISYYEQEIALKNAEELNRQNETENQENEEEKQIENSENIIYKPINYLGFFSEELDLGVYNVLNPENTSSEETENNSGEKENNSEEKENNSEVINEQENIIKLVLNYTYKNILEQIIIEEDPKQENIINFETGLEIIEMEEN